MRLVVRTGNFWHVGYFSAAYSVTVDVPPVGSREHDVLLRRGGRHLLLPAEHPRSGFLWGKRLYRGTLTVESYNDATRLMVLVFRSDGFWEGLRMHGCDDLWHQGVTPAWFAVEGQAVDLVWDEHDVGA